MVHILEGKLDNVAIEWRQTDLFFENKLQIYEYAGDLNKCLNTDQITLFIPRVSTVFWATILYGYHEKNQPLVNLPRDKMCK